MIDLEKFEENKIYNNFKSYTWYLINNLILNSCFPFSNLKIFILKLYGAKIGKNVIIKPYVKIKYPWNLKIGANCWIGEEVWIDNLAEVEIHKNCCISQGVYICTGNHNFKSKNFDLIKKKIIIEQSCWIGARCIICPGIIIKQNTITKVGQIIKN